MRRLSFSLFFLLPFFVEAQVSNFHLESGSIQYQRIYDVDGVSEDQLIEKLNSRLPSVSGLRDMNFNGSVFTGRIEGLMIDYKKFGGKSMTTWTALNFPMNAILTIQVKDNRYRVLLTDIETKGDDLLIGTYIFNSLVTKNKGTELTTNKTVLNGLDLIDKFLFEKFNFNSAQIEDDW
ncbi:MAG: hypothetical protein NBV61_03545 [Algoriphagus sp.]|nr:hypothetical protein [Algoriphagus sp.]